MPPKENNSMSNNNEQIPVEEIVGGRMPPWIHRFIKQAGRTINTFNMIEENDRVLLGISGGKDSLALALALALRKKWLPIDYKLEALHINWREHPIPGEKMEDLESFFRLLKIPFTSVTASMFPDSFQDDFNCYLCSRNRRRILFQHAADKGIRKVAMGHHLDDLVETSLINLCFRADFSTMLPVQEFFKGEIYVIRPLIQIKEHVLTRLNESYTIPTAKPVCPYDQTNIRSKLKPIIKDLSRIDKLTREHVFNAHNFSCRIPPGASEYHKSSRESLPQEKGRLSE